MVKRPGLVQNDIRDADLSDIVQYPPDAPGLQFSLFQPHSPAQVHGRGRHPGGVALGVPVLGLHGVRQGKEHILDIDQSVLL